MFFLLCFCGFNIGFAQPTLLLPADLAVNQSVTPTFSWTAVGGAFTYTLEVTEVGVGVYYTIPGIGSTSDTPPFALSSNTQYSWQVRVQTPAPGAYSAPFTFTTIAPLPPGIPVLAVPANNTL